MLIARFLVAKDRQSLIFAVSHLHHFPSFSRDKDAFYRFQKHKYH
jgi:hypothetical protein